MNYNILIYNKVGIWLFNMDSQGFPSQDIQGKQLDNA